MMTPIGSQLRGLSLRSCFSLLALVAGVAAAAISRDGGTAAAGGYSVGTVLHTPLTLRYGVPLDTILRTNLAAYRNYTLAAKAQGAQLMLFPESGTGFLQVPLDMMNLFCEPMPAVGWAASAATAAGADCGADWYSNATGMAHTYFASCLAQATGLDIVINFCGVDTNASEGTKMYNLDVAFRGGDGAVAAVYRKSHITGTGPVLSQPSTPDAVTFTTSFGVTFGMFTCYDFWFSQPQAAEIAAGVRDFLFPSEMASGPPYFTVPGAAVGWSRINGVNVVGSASFGTGFAGGASAGTLVDALPPMPANFSDVHAMLVVRMPPAPPAASSNTNNNNGREDRPMEAAVVNRGRRGGGDGAAAVAVHPPLLSTADVLAKRNARPTFISAGQRCVYGPPVNNLNFSYPCATFRPEPGRRYAFTVANLDRFGYEVECNGTVAVADASADGGAVGANETWAFGAVLLASPPTVATPSSLVTAMCLFVRCADPDGGCMTMDYFAGWPSQLRVSAASVATRFGGAFVASGRRINRYPMAGWSNGAAGRAGDPIAMHYLGRDEVTVVTGEPSNRNTTTAVERFISVSTDDKSAPVIKRADRYLWSFGVYADQFFRSLA